MGECWPWPGGRYSAGYGVANLRGKQFYAHRWTWELHHGPIPNGMHVLHRCDNPPCVNPSHLFLGTNTDNIHDMWSKGRASPPPHFYGEQHHNARLTEAQVRSIKRDHRVLREVAADNGVSISTISNIRRGKVWRAVE